MFGMFDIFMGATTLIYFKKQGRKKLDAYAIVNSTFRVLLEKTQGMLAQFLFHRLNCQMACAGSAHLTLLTLTATAVPRLWCLGNKFWAIKTKPVDSRDRIFSGPDSEYLIGPSKIVPLRSRLLFLLP